MAEMTEILRSLMDELRAKESHYKADTLAEVINRLEQRKQELAQAWSEGHDEGREHLSSIWCDGNPYRKEQS